MSETPQAPAKPVSGTPAAPSAPAPAAAGHAGDHHATGTGPKIHRVCIGCNNMFEVTMDNYETKHCSACHKG
ncbi:MAG TPA: hypothetical protein VMJ13_09590 [Candidatus Acidoferrum sp.]|nr:hypothetical protein [Candidatus Acidoferrum sp.]